MTDRPTPDELAAASFRISSYSGANNECVAVAIGVREWVCVRDSKLTDSPVLAVRGPAFTALTQALRANTP
ncbi:DUF397 domain-containing protein [Streptomyces sp. NPDC006512]|uniref:DUF397 domain-containing protein n=1 Tax=Streptomyces sp. NPDC006512 TaxID=3154307 RepID=UPI00339E7C94